MSYVIPQQLEYKEKIVFGLTLQQLITALIFGFPAWIFFTKTSYNTITKYVIIGIIGCTACLFIFFNTTFWIKEFFQYTTCKKLGIKSKRLKKLIGIKGINEGVISVNKQNLAIIQVAPLNYSIKTDDEKNVIDLCFQKFLNSLDFPIQIVINTIKLDIDKQFKTNNEIDNSFKNHLKNVIKDVKDKKFFIIIPEKNNNLKVQVSLVSERLSEIGLINKRLNDNEVIDLFKEFFKDNQEFEIKVSAEELNKNPAYYLIAPEIIINNVKDLQVNNDFYRIISAIGYPRSVEFGFLDKIISTNEDFDISIFIEPFSIDKTMLMLNNELKKQRADLYGLRLKNSISPSLEIQYKDTRRVLEDLQKGEQKIFNVSLYVSCKAKSKEELNLITKKVESELNSIMIIPKTAFFRQLKAYKSIIPLAQDELKIKRNVTTHALSAFFPFTSQFLNQENKGIFLGLNKNKIPITRDIFSLSNANGTILASSGGGKSYFSKLMIARYASKGVKVLVIDPQGEYTKIIEKLDGEVINISKNSESMINPLDFLEQDYTSKRLSLMSLFQIMIPDITEAQKSIIDKVITETYDKKGITQENPESWKFSPPTLQDLEKSLNELEKSAGRMERVSYKALQNRISMYTTGVFKFFNKPTNLDLTNDLVCFNVVDMPKQAIPTIMFLILDFIYSKMKQNKTQKLLVIDEAWSLLSRTEDSNYIFEIVKTCRKFNLGLLLITQDVDDLIDSKAGKAVLSNSAYTLLLRQRPVAIKSVVQHFNLSANEKNLLLTSGIGQGLLIMEDDHQEIEIIASPEEHELITTNPNEKKKEEKIVEVKEEVKDININLDLSQGLFRVSKLNKYEINYLINKGFVYTDNVPLGEQRQQKFLIKPSSIEGIDHTFLSKSIYLEIKKYTDKVEIYERTNPDIIFTLPNGKKCAIEIETGILNENCKHQLNQKIKRLKNVFGENWFFVITKSEYESYYKKIGRIIKRKDVNQVISQIYHKSST